MRLWEFQNGKMGPYSLKTDQDTTKNAKIQILKKWQFSLRKTQFFNKKLLFSKIWIFVFFAVSWSIFGLYGPILPFWNSQSLIFKCIYNFYYNDKY